ncbi:MAG: transglycosylase SLT domain-containing protein [Chloroflexota bacterium]
MAVRTKSAGRSAPRVRRFPLPSLPRRVGRYLPGWIVLIMVLAILTPQLINSTGRLLRSFRELFAPPGVIAPLFTPEVRHWGSDIERWAGEYNLDPNLLATVMQIESCGHPTVSSYAGAQGLFQVMPFHFAPGEDQLNPEINAQHGADVLHQCLINFAHGDPGLAMACYNGGPSVVNKPFTAWSNQTQRYYIWGMGIYTDASADQSQSTTLDLWLDAGGKILCQQAASQLGM